MVSYLTYQSLLHILEKPHYFCPASQTSQGTSEQITDFLVLWWQTCHTSLPSLPSMLSRQPSPSSQCMVLQSHRWISSLSPANIRAPGPAHCSASSDIQPNNNRASVVWQSGIQLLAPPDWIPPFPDVAESRPSHSFSSSGPPHGRDSAKPTNKRALALQSTEEINYLQPDLEDYPLNQQSFKQKY